MARQITANNKNKAEQKLGKLVGFIPLSSRGATGVDPTYDENSIVTWDEATVSINWNPASSESKKAVNGGVDVIKTNGNGTVDCTITELSDEVMQKMFTGYSNDRDGLGFDASTAVGKPGQLFYEVMLKDGSIKMRKFMCVTPSLVAKSTAAMDGEQAQHPNDATMNQTVESLPNVKAVYEKIFSANDYNAAVEWALTPVPVKVTTVVESVDK